jgi:hypothetical protein
MSKSWGNPTWFFFHTLIEKITPVQYDSLKQDLLRHIKIICSMLPCPDCANNATQYMKQIKHPLPTKDSFKQFLYQFHNNVNSRTRKKLYNYDDLTMYANVNLSVCYKLFRQEFTKKTYNPRMFMESMGRNKYIRELDSWLLSNKLI